MILYENSLTKTQVVFQITTVFRSLVAVMSHKPQICVGVEYVRNQLNDTFNWTWYDGNKATMDELKWDKSEPSDSDKNEHCGVIRTYKYGNMNDVPCPISLFGLCEKYSNLKKISIMKLNLKPLKGHFCTKLSQITSSASIYNLVFVVILLVIYYFLDKVM